MLFAVHCLDKPDHLALRLATRETHLTYLASLGPKVLIAGPYLDAAGAPNGSLLVFEADSQAEAEALAAGDPYSAAGLFQLVEVRPWRWVINPPKA